MSMVTPMQIWRTKKGMGIVAEGMDVVVLPLLQSFMEAQLREFQHDVVDAEAANLGVSAETFTDETLQEYRQLIEANLSTEPKWEFLEKMDEEERGLLRAACREDGLWRRTAVLTLNYKHNRLEPVKLWDETSACAVCQALAHYLKGKGMAAVN